MNDFEKFAQVVRKVGAQQRVSDGLHYVIHPLRSDIRYRLFSYRNTGEHIPGLVEHYESQFKNGWTWDNFSFVWDVSPRDPLKAVTQNEWLNEGGAHREERQTTLAGTVETVLRFYPNAFTKQGR